MTLMTRKEAAARLGMSLPTLDQERSTGRLAYIQRKPGSKVWITEEAIAEYLARATHQARPEMKTIKRRRWAWPKKGVLHMKPKRSLASVALELAAVLLVTALAFAWGKQTAQAERGYTAIGGEYLLLLLPAIYYTGKRTVLDWITDLRELTKGRY